MVEDGETWLGKRSCGAYDDQRDDPVSNGFQRAWTSFRHSVATFANSSFDPEVPALRAVDPLAARKLEGARTPALDIVTQLGVADVVDPELVAAEAAEPREHLGEDSRSKAAILFGREPAESVESVARLDLHSVDEVSSLGPAEKSEHLVDRELLASEHRGGLTGLGREQPRIRSHVELGPIIDALDDQPGEAWVDLNPMDRQTGIEECSLDGRDEPVDRGGRQAKEVEVARLTLNVTTGDSAPRRRQGRTPRPPRDPR